jgi:hypothetical protein
MLPVDTNFISLLEVDEQDSWFSKMGLGTYNKYNNVGIEQGLW